MAESPLKVHESRDFRSYQNFLRATRNYMEGPLIAQLHDRYERELTQRAAPRTAAEATTLVEPMPEFRLYAWLYRNLQRFKYSRPGVGIIPTVQRERDRLIAELDAAAASASPDELRLDPALVPPDYFQMVDFHQHPGGVAHDPLDGVIYEIARRTTVPQHADPNGIYRLLFDALPADRRYDRVLDWGTGHGAALLLWKELHPESDCHGVDLSAPCLKLAHKRARERHLKVHLSQQLLEKLDFPDNHFDLVFFNFMLHELPAVHHVALLTEVCRVLKPGGLFAGHEFHLRPDDPFQNVIQISHAWLNNETYSVPWYGVDVQAVARAAGFSRATVTPFDRLNKSVVKPGGRQVPANHWNLYVFEK